jgi:hypothetical protein
MSSTKDALTKVAGGASGGSVENIKKFADGGITTQPQNSYQQQNQQYWQGINSQFGNNSNWMGNSNAAMLQPTPDRVTAQAAAPAGLAALAPALASESVVKPATVPQSQTELGIAAHNQVPTATPTVTDQAQQGWYDPTSKLTNVHQMAQKLGVSPDEVMNIANLYRYTYGSQAPGEHAPQAFGSTQDAVSYMLGQGNNPDTPKYVQEMIDRAKTTAAATGKYGGMSAGTPSVWGYDPQGNYVGDLEGGKAVADARQLTGGTARRGIRATMTS